MEGKFSVQDIKSRIFKDSDGISNYIHVSIEEMDWLIEKVDQQQKDIKEGERIRDKQVEHLIRNGKDLIQLNEQLEMAQQEIERLKEDNERLLNLKGTLEEANQGMAAKLNELQEGN